MHLNLKRYIGKPKRILIDAGMEKYSGIGKMPVEEAMLRIEGFIGDGVADKVNHYANSIYLKQPKFFKGMESVLSEDWRKKLEQRITKAAGPEMTARAKN